MKRTLTAAIAASFLVTGAGAAWAAEGAHEGCPHRAAIKAEQAKAGHDGHHNDAKAACGCEGDCGCAADKAGCGCKDGKACEGCPCAKDGKTGEGCPCAKNGKTGEGCPCAKDGKTGEGCPCAKDGKAGEGCPCAKDGKAGEGCPCAKDGKAGCKHAKGGDTPAAAATAQQAKHKK